MKTKTIEHLRVRTPQGDSGMLARETGAYFFQYHPTINAAAEVSLTMPHRMDQYRSELLFPLFEMNMPEGYVLEELRNRFAKAGRFDPMLLLALTGREAAIGRVMVETPDVPGDEADKGVSLTEILAWNGAEDLFTELSHRYLSRTGVSGVQPKLLVPEDTRGEIYGKGALTTRELIVKSAGDKYPGLAVNEFVCMSMAKAAGIPVAEFHLSENRRLFVMRRFDRTAEGMALGFEDMAVLMGRTTADKYKGSYTQIAKALQLFCAPEQVAQALAQLFDQVALSCIVGNGDAHLKNFGVLYTDPLSIDARMAPAYDIVNTTCYIPEDGLALSLKGTRNLFVARLELMEFARDCDIANPQQRIGEILEACETTLTGQAALLRDFPDIETAIRQGVEQFQLTYGKKAAT
ncbi:type II toxin-antitoxin system HipA family toxin [Dyella acidisoli]|uniref:HipA family protein n=1 Tax=Dyella acidisoli TaxID=1867834 RepID=A0ABQ5XRG3_9GAMM|nr:type II toxin-antitoxin system HipA family toxin [Dyella acidisoli]GLQ93819.1 hipA family protein [Dyella acidisoli]